MPQRDRSAKSRALDEFEIRQQSHGSRCRRRQVTSLRLPLPAQNPGPGISGHTFFLRSKFSQINPAFGTACGHTFRMLPPRELCLWTPQDTRVADHNLMARSVRVGECLPHSQNSSLPCVMGRKSHCGPTVFGEGESDCTWQLQGHRLLLSQRWSTAQNSSISGNTAMPGHAADRLGIRIHTNRAQDSS
eukprot:XP_008769694.1 PREDICTED: uncharacterized protein LOC102555503 [Rattus norvegicus]